MQPRIAVLGAVVSLLMQPAAPVHAQNGPETIRGHVSGTDRPALIHATVIVTGSLTEMERRTQTDTGGNYSVTFIAGESSYLVTIRSIGYAPALRRVVRSGTNPVIVQDVLLAPTAFPLEPLTVNASRGTRSTQSERPATGGVSHDLTRLRSLTSEPGDANSLLALAPGLAADAGGVSAPGASPEQNSMLLDGMALNESTLPPDAICSANAAITTSDPSRSFTGAQLALTSCTGHNHFESTLRLTLLDPALGWSDNHSPVLPARVLQGSGFVSGPLRAGTGHYRLSFIADTRATEAPTLLEPAVARLTDQGIRPDSLTALAAALGQSHVPLTVAGAPSALTQRNATAAGRVDWTAGHSTTLMLTGNIHTHASDGAGLSERSYPTGAMRRTGSSGRLVFRAAGQVGTIVDELTMGLSAAGTASSPYSNLPRGVVRVGTIFDDGATGVTALQFGGGASQTHTSASQFEIRNTETWYPGGSAHQLTLGQSLSVELSSRSHGVDSPGLFSYQSLADLAANRPASYTRSLGRLDDSYRYSRAAIWLGDLWRASRTVSFEGGVRAEAAWAGTTPYNAGIDSTFGRRTDRWPSEASLSPRVGFAWLLHRRESYSRVNSATGQREFYDFADPPGEAYLPRGNFGNGLTLFGGAGAFHGFLSPTRLASAAAQTGLPGGVSTLACVGDAVPIPDWSVAATSTFDRCADGAGSSQFSGSQVAVSILDPSFRAPKNVMINVGFTGLTHHEWGVDGMILVKRGQQYESRTDLNFDPTTRFTLPGEGARPVFAPPNAVVPSSGLIYPNAARINSQFGGVYNAVSDLHSNAIQFSLSGYGLNALGVAARLTYTYTAQSIESRGFAGTTAGDPRVVESFHGGQPQHQFILDLLPQHWGWVTGHIRLTVQSGTAYTPVVVGDINGDGLSNDRAFIFEANSARDPLTASQMQSLLAAAPSSARSCLVAQANTVASINSCRGPWQSRLDLALTLAPPGRAWPGARLRSTVQFLGAGAALVRLFGGSSTLLSGTDAPDPRLLYLTGFDATTRRYRYRVNQSFGEPLDLGTDGHAFLPFQVRIGAEYLFASAAPKGALHRYDLEVSKQRPYTEARVMDAVYRIARNPADTILALADSLALSAEQRTWVEALHDRYRVTVDSVFAPLVGYILKRASAMTDGELDQQLAPLLAALSPRRIASRDGLVALLSPDQRAKLSALLARR